MKFDPELPGEESFYGIVEVHYTSEGAVKCYTETAIRVTWDEGEDGAKMLELMVKAFTLPVLTPADCGG